MSLPSIHLGYAVGSGEPVEIPIRNTVVTGQTQESGKTTTLEAMVQRSGVQAIAFVTKRGEGGFESGRRLAPYFRERTDWEFVAGILEAERREKLKIERAWIIRACKGARTLADVHANNGGANMRGSFKLTEWEAMIGELKRHPVRESEQMIDVQLRLSAALDEANRKPMTVKGHLPSPLAVASVLREVGQKLSTVLP